jgi:hypothetical protein
MARYELTIKFDCDPAETETYVQLAATLIGDSVENYGLTKESVELIDHQAVEPRWQGGVDWLEWCQTEEAQTER